MVIKPRHFINKIVVLLKFCEWRWLMTAIATLLLLTAASQSTWATGGAECTDGSLAKKINDLGTSLDAAKQLYRSYLLWINLAQNRSIWQQMIADHLAAVQELRSREAKVISILSELYTSGSTAFHTGADGSGYNYTNGNFHKGVKPFFPKDLGGEDGTDWADVINDERAQTSQTLATFVTTPIAETDMSISPIYCPTGENPPPPPPNPKGYLGKVVLNFCYKCPSGGYPGGEIPGCKKSWLERFGGGAYNWNEQRKKELNLRGISINAMRAIDDLNAKGKALQQEMAAQGATGVGGTMSDDDLKAKFLAFLPARYVDLYNQLAVLRTDSCAKLGLNSLNKLYQRVTGEARQYEVARLAAAYGPSCPNPASQMSCTQPVCTGTGSNVSCGQSVCTLNGVTVDPACLPPPEKCVASSRALVNQDEIAAVVAAATGLALETADFTNLRGGTCGPQYSGGTSTAASSCAYVTDRYMYDIPTAIAWAQQNASAIPGNKAKFKKLTCGDATYPLY
ncbi:MAG: hypothetical protein FGM23_02790 [Alphaproteobacteria bacterium]|nr:hypothetical protein [Alphaproteobacteria bacterium]